MFHLWKNVLLKKKNSFGQKKKSEQKKRREERGRGPPDGVGVGASWLGNPGALVWCEIWKKAWEQPRDTKKRSELDFERF